MDRHRDDAAAIAALNNAQWCAAVWRSHGLLAEQAHGMWFTRSPAPPLYPNAVTVDPSADTALQTAFIEALATDFPGFAVKDSFDCLPLATRGFRPLLKASWLWGRSIDLPGDDADHDRWRRVATVGDLAAWEDAWRGDQDVPAGLFKATLLSDPKVTMVAGTNASGAIVAGGIGYRSAEALGVTNVFGDRTGAFQALRLHSSTEAIVGYERGSDLQAALRQGFEATGQLTVWVRGT